MAYKLISKILINTLLISILISIFLYTFGLSLGKDIISNQINIISDSLMDGFKLFGNNNNKKLYEKINTDYLSNEKIKKITPSHIEILKKNKKNINTAKITMGLFTILIVIIVYVLYCLDGASSKTDFDFNNKWKLLIIESFVVAGFVGLSGYTFLQFFCSDVILVDTNHIKLNIIKKLREYKYVLN